ncbi:MAG TPA: HAMP domain-containing sensor histidine kinase [Myxococcota bacterium]|nr:HAMP domain-containing sensor histidine kinase [Myxococcota bacterium]
MTRRPRLRSIRTKLVLVFFVIIAAAFGLLYFIATPQLETKLEQRQLDDIQSSAQEVRPRIKTLTSEDLKEPELNEKVRAYSEETDARVTLLGIDEHDLFYTQSDSRTEKDAPFNSSLARKAIRTEHAQTEIGPLAGEELAQVAQPFFRGRGKKRQPVAVVFYARDLNDVAEAVDLVRNRVLVATGVALALAMLGAFLVAQALARRVGRLEMAADEVAHGRFIDPLPVDSKDELGQLTRTFNQMQAQLRQVDVARKEFIATASHELRTPIFSLAGFVELLQDEDLDDDTRREFLETMAEQVERLQKLSVDLLDLSRLDSDSVELHTEPVDLAELTRSVAGEFHPRLAEHGTDLVLDVPEDGPSASCDRERVAQIMRILLDNALRHTPEGTDVTVRASRYNGAAELTVADTGPGLPAGARAKVFERFFTGDAGRGAGLGLAIARELAERMDGRLVLSTDRDTTAFTLELPADGNGA